MALLDFVVKKDKVYDYVYRGFAVFIFFIAAFRGMGNDYKSYEEIFDSIQNLSLSDIFDASEVFVEPGFTILNIIVGRFFPYQAILVIMALANIAILFPFFRKYSPYPYVTLLFFAGMFMYSGMMGLIRQSLAIAICMWAMVEPRNKRFFWLIALAMMFHSSAIFVALVRFLKNSYYSLKTYFLLLVIAIFSNIFLFELFKSAISFMPPVIEWKLNIYVGTEEGLRFGFNSAVAIRLFTSALAYLYRVKLVDAFPKYGALFANIYFLSVLLYVGFGFLPQMAARGAVYFHYMELLVVPMILYVANKYNRAWIFFIFASLSLMRHIDLITEYAEAYLPYKNIIFN